MAEDPVWLDPAVIEAVHDRLLAEHGGGLHRPRAAMLIVVRKPYFDQLRAGTKRVEYRRYGPRFNERVFRIGRRVAFGYRRDRSSPRLPAVVTSFATLPVSELPEMLEIYPDMAPDALIACIGVAVEECER